MGETMTRAAGATAGLLGEIWHRPDRLAIQAHDHVAGLKLTAGR